MLEIEMIMISREETTQWARPFLSFAAHRGLEDGRFDNGHMSLLTCREEVQDSPGQPTRQKATSFELYHLVLSHKLPRYMAWQVSYSVALAALVCFVMFGMLLLVKGVMP